MKIRYNTRNLKMIDKVAKLALIETAEATKTDLIQSQTMPFRSGTMQNDSIFVENERIDKGVVKIVIDTPYSRKMYFHPEYKFYKEKNPNAGGRWFDVYISGEKKNKIQKMYQKFLKRRMQ